MFSHEGSCNEKFKVSAEVPLQVEVSNMIVMADNIQRSNSQPTHILYIDILYYSIHFFVLGVSVLLHSKTQTLLTQL